MTLKLRVPCPFVVLAMGPFPRANETGGLGSQLLAGASHETEDVAGFWGIHEEENLQCKRGSVQANYHLHKVALTAEVFRCLQSVSAHRVVAVHGNSSFVSRPCSRPLTDHRVTPPRFWQSHRAEAAREGGGGAISAGCFEQMKPLIASQKKGAKRRTQMVNTQASFVKIRSFFGAEIVTHVITESRSVVFGIMRDHEKASREAGVAFISFGDRRPKSADARTSARPYFSTAQCGRIGMWISTYLAFTIGQCGQRSQFFTQMCAGQFADWYTKPTNRNQPNHSRIQSLGVTNVPMAEKVDSRKRQPVLVRREFRDDVKLVCEWIARFTTGKSLKKLSVDCPVAPLLPHYKNAEAVALEAKMKPKHVVRNAGTAK